MEYIREGATLPVPFNIVPTPKSFYYLALKCFNLFRRGRDEQQSAYEPERRKKKNNAETGAAEIENQLPNLTAAQNLNQCKNLARKHSNNDNLTYTVTSLFSRLN
jgi:hypothetical protein